MVDVPDGLLDRGVDVDVEILGGEPVDETGGHP
jgi:hypothetical protein